MIDLTFTATSTRYVWLPFRGVDPNTGATVDVSAAVLKAAMLRGTDLPNSDGSDWVAADADGERTIGGKVYALARVLVGPAAPITLEPGDYTAWVRVELGAELIEEPVGQIRAL